MFWLLFPVLTVISYFSDWSTMFYVCGSIALAVDIINLIRGEFVNSAITIQLVLSGVAWIITGSFLDGVLLGGSLWGVISIIHALIINSKMK